MRKSVSDVFVGHTYYRGSEYKKKSQLFSMLPADKYGEKKQQQASGIRSIVGVWQVAV